MIGALLIGRGFFDKSGTYSCLFAVLGLVLEHNKTELFYFDCSHSDHNPSLDLGYAPYMGDCLLTPKTYWRYLRFYFDQKLLFTKYV